MPVLAYATPVALDPLSAFCAGDLVAKAAGAEFPPRCVRCNAPATRSVRVNLRHYPWFKLVLTTVYRHVSIPLCDAHVRRVVRRQRLGWAVSAAGFVLFLSSTTCAVPGFVGGRVAAFAFIAALALVLIGDRIRERRSPLRVVRVTKTHVYFSGAGESFLASLERST